MNRLYLILIFCFLYITTAHSQVYSVERGTIEHKKDRYTSIEAIIEPEKKPVKKAWEDFVDQKYNIDLKGMGFLSNKDLLTAKGSMINAITDDDITFYSHFEEQSQGTKISVFARLKNGEEISPENNTNAYNNMERMLRSFLEEYLPAYYKEQYEKEQDLVADLEKKVTDIREEIVDNEEEIRKLQQENRDLEKQLSNDEVDLKLARERLMDKKEKLKSVQEEL